MAENISFDRWIESAISSTFQLSDAEKYHIKRQIKDNKEILLKMAEQLDRGGIMTFLNRPDTYYGVSHFFTLSENEQEWRKKVFITQFIDKYGTKLGKS